MEELDKYEEELRQMNEAIKLQKELQALLELTEQSENAPKSSNSVDPMADEMALFMSEIKNIDKVSEDTTKCFEQSEEYELHLEAIKNELKAMIGKKCSAPHEHLWGAKTYHNAIICGLDDSKDYDLNDIKEFRLRILFTNPTHREMIPCSYFLEGDCRFDVDKCRYSHGELIPFGELKEYKEPEFNKLKRNCVVLAKMDDKLWHRGRVLSENFEQKTCRVRLDTKKKDIDFDFEDLFPIFHDDDLSSGSSSDSEDYFDKVRHAQIVEQSLLNPAPNQALGEWEKYTKGIGSKLMQKMGYVVGTGLGTNGEGIIIPVSAQVLPPGRSLDHCMELREAANGDQNLFSVERKMKKEQKKQEALSAKVYERESNKTDLFSFLNENIFTNGPSTSDITKNNLNKITVNKKTNINYENHTTKNLNVESVKISDDIRKMERDINKIKDSMKRHSNSTEIYKKLKRTLDVKNEELNSLRKSESSLQKEQISRKHKDKLSIF